jgi:chromosome partitioning protein
MRVIAVMNQKGGVGKTTTTLNLAHALIQAGQRVLALDLDPQAQLGMGLGADHGVDMGMDKVLLDDVPIEHVSQILRPGLSGVIAGSRLSEVEHMTGGAERGWRLKRALDQVTDDHDIALIDCPPSSGLLGVNALFAADEVLIPVSGDYLGMHGLSRLMNLFSHVERTLGRTLKRWLVLTRFQARRRLARDVRKKLLEYFPRELLATSIRESVALAESPGFRKSIFEYRRTSPGAEDYRALASELLNGRT